MSKIPQLTKELEEAIDELNKTDKEFYRLEGWRKHLKDVIKDRKMKLSNCRKGALAPVEVQTYTRDENGLITHRFKSHFQTVYEATKEFDFSIYDYMSMNINCSHEEDDFKVMFSMDMGKLPQVIKEGKVILCSFKGYSVDTDYFSGILESPTYFYALQEFHQSVYTTKDKHHLFLESIQEVTSKELVKSLSKKHGEGITFMQFCTGS